jgi:hypothetical protein
MYTSGCPKNQKRCTKRIGSPPPPGVKNLVLKLRSVRSIVIPPAKTGSLRINKIAVKKTLQIKRGSSCHDIPCLRRFKIVHMKLMDPPIEEAPAM